MDLTPAVSAGGRVRWKTPLKAAIQNLRTSSARVYAGMKNGELAILDLKTGNILNSRKLVDKDLTVDYVTDHGIVASSPEAIVGVDPLTGVKQWDYPSNPAAKKPVYIRNVVVLQTSTSQITALDAETGRVVWQYAGSLLSEPILLNIVAVKAPPSIYVTSESLFILEPGGIKEYSLDRGENQGITDKEALTQLAGAFLSKGDVQEASRYAQRVAEEADPSYPPLRYLQARLDQARGNTASALAELVAYVDLVGRQSRAGQEVLSEFKRTANLLWQTDLGAAIAGAGRGGAQLADGKIVTVSRLIGRDSQVVALEAENGSVLWRQTAERFLDVAVDGKSKRVFYARGLSSNPRLTQLYAVNLSTSERKQLAQVTAPFGVYAVNIAYANGRVFVSSTAGDIPAQRVSLRIDAFDSASGDKLWEKTFDRSGNLVDNLRSPLGLFFPHGDYFVYSVDGNVSVVRAADGQVYSEIHEEGVLPQQWSRYDTASLDPDVIYFNAANDELVSYSQSGKKVLARVRPMYPGITSVCACNVRPDGTVWDTDSTSLVSFAIPRDSSGALQPKWNVPANTARRIGADGNYFWANRQTASGDPSIVKIDPATGQVLRTYEYPFLWTPSGAAWDEEHERVYVFSADSAYAVQLKPVRN